MWRENILKATYGLLPPEWEGARENVRENASSPEGGAKRGMCRSAVNLGRVRVRVLVPRCCLALLVCEGCMKTL
jgi:hypothetical protein